MANQEKKNSGTSISLKNWKIRSELLRLINIECATHGFTQAQLADLCWNAYLKTGGAFRRTEERPNSKHDDIRNYFHWLIDRLLDTKNPQFDAIDANLTLLAFALYHAGEHPITDMRAFLKTLYKNEMAEREKSQEPSSEPKPKKAGPASKKTKK